jgi:hypothetical protein
MSNVNEAVLQECECCDGSGVVGRGHPNDPSPEEVLCECCAGAGVIEVEAEEVDQDWMDEE